MRVDDQARKPNTPSEKTGNPLSETSFPRSPRATGRRWRWIAGYETAYGNFLLFDRRGQAEYWQEALGDKSRRNGSILVDMSGRTFTVQDKQAAVDALFGARDWS